MLHSWETKIENNKRNKVETIRAEVYRQHGSEPCARFNAERWFAKATDAEIKKVIKGDFASPSTDIVAHFMSDYATDVKATGINVDKPLAACGLECHISRRQALDWLKENKPELLPG